MQKVVKSIKIHATEHETGYKLPGHATNHDTTKVQTAGHTYCMHARLIMNRPRPKEYFTV